MKNATIATSRTRASADHVIAYRPLPEAWGDVESLRAVRARKARAAARGTDPSTLEIAASETRDRARATKRRPASRPSPVGHHRSRPHHAGLLAPVLGMLQRA